MRSLVERTTTVVEQLARLAKHPDARIAKAVAGPLELARRVTVHAEVVEAAIAKVRHETATHFLDK